MNADGDNALHVAVKEGHVAVVRSLLTECSLDAETVNLKGRNPLHELARYGRDNAATICDLFLECMPKYPLNKSGEFGLESVDCVSMLISILFIYTRSGR